MKKFALMALLGTALAEKEETPAACPSDEITESDCSRLIETVGVKFTYWVNMEGKVPTFHGHFDIVDAGKDVTESTRTVQEIRVCFEVAKEEFKTDWREQIAFHADLANAKFDEPPHVMKKSWENNKLA